MANRYYQSTITKRGSALSEYLVSDFLDMAAFSSTENTVMNMHYQQLYIECHINLILLV